VLLAPDDWSFPRLNFQHGATPPSGPGRVHLDLTTADMAAEVDRLIGLGATKLWTIDVAQSGTTTWTTMRDPDGNEFCVVSDRPVREPASHPQMGSPPVRTGVVEELPSQASLPNSPPLTRQRPFSNPELAGFRR
jgi:hypothetical protein